MQKVTKSLLLEYHAGRATSLQVKLIEAWLKDPRNESLFYQTLFEWESDHPQYGVDLPAGLERYHRAMDSFSHSTSEVRPHSAAIQAAPGRRPFFNWLIAASIAGLLLLAAGLLHKPVLYKTHATTFGEIARVQLPDGSRVTLNANSELRFSRFAFGRQQRDVFLTGEAEFSVVHTQNHQRFVVHTNRELNVEVLGTEFVVLARDRATRVVLTKGKVRLHYAQPNQQPKELTMRPGDQATLGGSMPGIDGKLVIKQALKPEEFSAWKEHRFVFNDTPLREICDLIKDNYGLSVTIKGDNLAKRMVSGTFEAADANELLDVLKELLVIDVIRQRNHIVLSEKSTK